MTSPPDGRAGLDAAYVARLVAEQFPDWVGLPVRPVPDDGWDNRTYRLGEELTVRLPTAQRYVAAVEKENTWLPRLAPHLPVPVPEVVAVGRPGLGYPYPWSVRRWLPGDVADARRITDLAGFAVAVAEFLRALRRCDAEGGPRAGAHSFFRGASPEHYDDETRACLRDLASVVDVGAATAVWDAALTAEWTRPPVWFHGDVAVGNLLVRDGRLAAVLDFGTCGVGDPACDLVLAWTLLSGRARVAFRDAVDQDDATWARARGWALWKALLTLRDDPEPTGAAAQANRALIATVIADAGRG